MSRNHPFPDIIHLTAQHSRDSMEPDIRAAFDQLPPEVRQTALNLRDLICETARTLPETGGVTECLKWGQPAWLPVRKAVGTTVRIGAEGGDLALYVHCQTGLIEEFQRHYADKFRFSGNRALLIDGSGSIPSGELAHCIALALTYHARKKQPRQ
tara:strand:- start:1487 stop:1951 length:465 start_codon:yes stop_codon:yes gene_type:complete